MAGRLFDAEQVSYMETLAGMLSEPYDQIKVHAHLPLGSEQLESIELVILEIEAYSQGKPLQPSVEFGINRERLAEQLSCEYAYIAGKQRNKENKVNYQIEVKGELANTAGKDCN